MVHTISSWVEWKAVFFGKMFFETAIDVTRFFPSQLYYLLLLSCFLMPMCLACCYISWLPLKGIQWICCISSWFAWFMLLNQLDHCYDSWLYNIWTPWYEQSCLTKCVFCISVLNKCVICVELFAVFFLIINTTVRAAVVCSLFRHSFPDDIWEFVQLLTVICLLQSFIFTRPLAGWKL